MKRPNYQSLLMCLSYQAMLLFISYLSPEIVTISETQISIDAEIGRVIWVLDDNTWCVGKSDTLA